MQNPIRPSSATDSGDAVSASAVHKPSLKHQAIEEFRHYFVITLYLWVLFVLFSIYKRMILQQHGVSVWEQSFAIINAMVFGKVILIAQALNLGAGLRKYPLIFSVVGSSIFFTIVLFAFHILEEAIRASVMGLPLGNSVVDFGGGNLQGFLTLGAIVFVALIPLFIFQEVARVVGVGALWELFLSRGGTTFRLIKE